MTLLPPELGSAFERLLPGVNVMEAHPLAGGVSSDIWRVTTSAGDYCAKRALPRLKVAGDWQAPIERNRYEADYLSVVGTLVPGTVPTLIGRDVESGVLIMEYLDPRQFRLWKADLLAGRLDPALVVTVAEAVGRIHAATSTMSDDLRRRFATDHLFHRLRLDPYWLEIGRRHPSISPGIARLVERAVAAKKALVHGDVSPKNILIGPQGPILLDAECAWFGDPAFDPAFCLNHLFLKSYVHPDQVDAFAAAIRRFWDAYRGYVGWEDPAALEDRLCAMIPALLLARLDGKSPVEYLARDLVAPLVRDFCIPRILDPPERLADLVGDWVAYLKNLISVGRHCGVQL